MAHRFNKFKKKNLEKRFSRKLRKANLNSKPHALWKGGQHKKYTVHALLRKASSLISFLKEKLASAIDQRLSTSTRKLIIHAIAWGAFTRIAGWLAILVLNAIRDGIF